MRSGYLLLGLCAMGCVDLTTPPGLNGTAHGPDDAAATATGDGPGSEDGPLSRDGGETPADLTMQALDGGATDETVIEPPDVGAPEVVAADGPAMPDAAMAPDTTVIAPDAAVVAPDAAPDVALAIDLARDLAPDLAVDVARDLAPDLAPDVAPDLAPDAGPPALVVDDFQGAVATRNNLNSEVTWDNETCSRINGESVCSYSGTGNFHDFIETFNNWCSFDARPYSKIRFRMRTTVPEQVDVLLGVNASACPQMQSFTVLGTISTTTTMTTYSFDISAVPLRGSIAALELDPKSLDNAQFILDDVELVP